MTFSRRLNWPAGLLLFAAPAANLVWRGGTGYCFFLLLALALYGGWTCRRNPAWFAPYRRYPWFVAGMLAMLAAVVAQQAIDGYWLPRQFDPVSRFALVLLILPLLCALPTAPLRAIGWGCTAGALAVAVYAIAQRPPGGWTDAARLDNYYTNAIPFGDTALLFAFLAVFTFGWDSRYRRAALAVKLLGLVAGGFVSYMSGTRGGWLAVPVFVVLLAFQYRWIAHWRRLAIAFAVVVACAAALLATERVQHRLRDASSDLMLLQRGDADTSVGLRVQLWRASLQLFREHPLFGVGKGHLTSALADLVKRGDASPQIVNERAHSDFFSTLAELGLVGITCLLLFYFGSTVYFWRHRRATDPAIRTAAYSGLAVSLSTIVYGLTIDVLVPVMVTALLALLSAALLAVIDVRKRELARFV